MYGPERAVYSTKYAEPDHTQTQEVQKRNTDSAQSAVAGLAAQTNKVLENVKYEVHQLVYALEDRGFLRPASPVTGGGSETSTEKALSGVELFLGTAIDELYLVSRMLVATRDRLP